MTVYKCDKCKKEITDITQKFQVGLAFTNATLCYDCFQPYLDLLIKDAVLPARLIESMNY